MNVLFLSLLDFDTFDERNIYSDLLREFIKNGHKIYCISPVERKKNQDTKLLGFGESCILKLKIGNTQKTNIIEKGISTVMIEPTFKKAIKKYFSDVKFDLVLYSTPPITLVSAIEYVKKRDGAKTYLLLKDIFPQNAVDIGMMSKTGLKGLLYRYFRAKEKKMYRISDCIGCMSQANVQYVIDHNPEIDREIVEVCPNCIEVQSISITKEERVALRDKYGIPNDKKVFLYGGNLGKPQGVPFIIECLKKLNGHPDAYFLIVGDGTEYGKLQDFFYDMKPDNMKLLKRLPKEEYDYMVAACDVGLIFLDHRFTIPNFPSRLLAYMQAGLPVIAATDTNTDIGKVIVEGGFGWWCESNDVENFCKTLTIACNENYEKLKNNEEMFLMSNYTTDKAYTSICAKMNIGN